MQKFQVMFLCKRTGVRLKVKLGRLASWVLVVELHMKALKEPLRGDKDKGIFAAGRVGFFWDFALPGVFGPPEQRLWP